MSVTKPASRSSVVRKRSKPGLEYMSPHGKRSFPLPVSASLVWLMVGLAVAMGCATTSGKSKEVSNELHATSADQASSLVEETILGPESNAQGDVRTNSKTCLIGEGSTNIDAARSTATSGPSDNGYKLQTYSWDEHGIREEWSQGYARIAFEQVVGEHGYRHFNMDQPSRLVIDVPGPYRDVATHSLRLHNGVFEKVRIGRHPDKIRYVLDARGPELPVVRVAAQGRDVIVEAGDKPLAVREPASSSGDAPSRSTAVAQTQWKAAQVEKIDFSHVEDVSKVIVSLDKSTHYDIREEPGKIILALPGATLSPQARLPLDTSAFASSAVSRIEPSQAGSGPLGEARISIGLKEKVPYHVVKEENALVVEIPAPKVKAEAPLPGPKPPVTVPSTTAAPVPPTAPSEARPAAQEPRALEHKVPTEGKPYTKAERPVLTAPKDEPPAERPYTGRKISLDFKDADLQNVLRIIAEVSGKNIVISDSVKGKATIRLVDTPWDMALDVILKTYALDKEELGPNIFRVAPYTQLKKEREEARKADEALQQVEPLVMKIVPTNYAKGKDLEPLLQKFKSKRPEAGILVDSRTNSIIIKDLPEHVDTMEKLIRELDTQTPEVLIEARIVELQVDYEKQLGVQWGTMYRAGPATGNPTGLNFPGIIGVGGTQTSVPNSMGGISNPVVNLPASVGEAAGGALGISLGSLTNSLQLDMVLSALEKKNHAKVISSPRVVTVNNQEAKIIQGQEVPQMTVSANEGTKVEYKEAALKLSVTPQVTADKSIIMNIVISNDTPTLGANNLYIINKKEATTSVLVKDGETAVIGGIFTNNDTEAFGAVPWFHKIPGLGHLFKATQKVKKRTELVIFITPRILPVRTAG